MNPSVPGTDEQAIVMHLYVALHRLEYAIDAAVLLARSPHWIGGREIAIVAAGMMRQDAPPLWQPMYALFDLADDATGDVRARAVDVIVGSA